GIEEIRQIVDLLIKEVNERINHKNVTIRLTASARDWIADKGYDPNLGARPLRRTIQEYIENELSQKLITGEIEWERLVTVDVDFEKDQLVFKAEALTRDEKPDDLEVAPEKDSVERV
ncbi:hypothetical protein JW877_08910, partial [bacterium]|nr:hypothetical protein [bacterium]